jgi:hypothetical protein
MLIKIDFETIKLLQLELTIYDIQKAIQGWKKLKALSKVRKGEGKNHRMEMRILFFFF